MSHRWWLSKTTRNEAQRVVRCSGKGCPGGFASCIDTCLSTATAMQGNGLIQDWRLTSTGTHNRFKLCALGNPSLCTAQAYNVVTFENDDITPTFESTAFVLQLDGSRLCLSRGNLSLPQPCNIASLEQRWMLGQYTRLESEVRSHPSSSITALASNHYTRTCRCLRRGAGACPSKRPLSGRSGPGAVPPLAEECSPHSATGPIRLCNLVRR